MNKISKFMLSSYFTLGLMVTSFIGVLVIIFNTSPIKIGPAGMLLAFGVFYIWFFSLFLGVMHGALALKSGEDSRSIFLNNRLVTLAAALAFMPLILLALQSIGQLYLTSVGLVIAFEVLAAVYILRR